MKIVAQHDIRKRIDSELNLAHKARSQGNEGRARVCARRAAGWAVAAYRQRNFGIEPHANAFRQLRWLRTLEGASQEIRDAASRLTTRVSLDHSLPHDEDPLEDARMLIQALLGS
ncbi:MAG: hypothetical protein GTO14_25840 [Anaerolineales bacterium]|nr:hypothetical protein [Anaerolineales bacterium]